jgi:hypothetical protein
MEMKKSLWAVGLGLVVMVGGYAQTAAAPGARLAALPAAKIKAVRDRLDATLLPAGASHLEMTKGQTFTLTDGAETVMTLVPVGFYVMTPSSFLSVCGLYMLPATGPGRFVTTYGMRDEKDGGDVEDYWECARTTAIGVMPNEGAHPRLLMTMAGFSPPQHETVMPIVMTWDAGKGSYVVKDDVFRDDSFVGDATVAKMRRALAKLK